MKIRWVIFALILIALLASAVQPVLAQEVEEPQGLRPDAPEYALRGPHWVGYRPIVIGEDTEQPLGAGLWYPALNPEGAAEEITYALPWIPPWIPLSDEDTAEAYGHALLDTPVDDAMGPYPLIVFSHGFTASPEWYSSLIEHYASHGFVVLAPEHAGESDWMENATPTVTRLSDMARTLDYAEEAAAADGELAGILDMENVAAVGHSYGGYTSLAMAGAQFDMEGFTERCAALTEDDPNIFLCLPLMGKEEQLAEGLGLDSVPDGLWPSFGDPRVTAAVSMAGDSYIFDKAGLAQITIPVLAIGGTADTGTDYDWGIKPTYDYAASEKKALFAFNGGEHMIVGNPCENMPFLLDSDAYGFACIDPVWDKLRGLDLTNHATTAFLLDTLKGDQAAHAALAPETMSFPGIAYQAEGFAAEPPEAELVRRWLHLWDTVNGDMDDFDEIISEDFVSHNMPEGDREVMRSGIEGFRTDNPGAYFLLEELAISDGKAYITNSMWMMPEDVQEGDEGEPVSPPFLLVLDLEDGQVTERWLFVTPE